MYNGHVYFEHVQPQILKDVLQYLKINNPFYQNTVIDMNTIPTELICFTENTQLEVIVKKGSEDIIDSNEEEEENPLDLFRIAANETVMTSKIPHAIDNDTLVVAPGEGKKLYPS